MSLVQPASHRPCAYCAHTFFLKSSAYFYSKILIATREVLLFILNFETKKKKKEKRKKSSCFFPFLLSPNFGPYFLSQCHCVLNVLGRCNRLAIDYRYATENWCEKSNLSMEDALKVQGKPLYQTHSRHPEAINRPTTPSSPSKKHRVETPTSSSPLSLSNLLWLAFPAGTSSSPGRPRHRPVSAKRNPQVCR